MKHVGTLDQMWLQFRALAADRLVRNIGWYGLAEIANRLTRLITAVILARVLLPEDFGIAATAITIFEIISVLAMTGIGQAVGRAQNHELAAVLNTARRASTIVCLAAAALQVGIGSVIWAVTGRLDVLLMVTCLAGVYLTLPYGQVQAHLIVRANRLHVLAAIALIQVAADNMLTAGLAIAGFGAWAIVLPKLVTAPIWVLGMRHAQAWSYDPAAGHAPMVPLARFAGAVIVSDLLVAARFHLDKVLVGLVLGLEALGIYYFVFCAGIGFSLSLTGALAASAYPHLTELVATPRRLLARYDALIWQAALPVAGIIALQAALAPLYVPFVFGERWAPYAWMVAALCASAAVKPMFDCACQLLRALGLPRLELLASAGLTAIALGALMLGLQGGLATGIAALATATATTQLVVAFAIRRAIGRRLTDDPRFMRKSSSSLPEPQVSP